MSIRAFWEYGIDIAVFSLDAADTLSIPLLSLVLHGFMLLKCLDIEALR